MVYAQYTWVLGLTVPVAFISAFGIGANDVANSFASSVGSKALTMGQAICVAAVCEFLGAVLLGASVTDTVKNSIAKTSAYRNTPALLMYVMFSSLFTSAIWDNLTCHLELPVSTTHTIVGSIAGSSIAVFGFDSVLWSAHKADFPYIQGMSPIFASWGCSPAAAAIMVAILYGCIVRPFILRSPNSFARAAAMVPILMGLTVFVIVIFVIQTGNKNKTWDTPFATWKSVVLSLGLGLFFTLFVGFLVVPLLRRRINRDHAALNQPKTAAADVNITTEQIKEAELENGDIIKGATAPNASMVNGPPSAGVINDINQGSGADGVDDKISKWASIVYRKSGLKWASDALQKTSVGRVLFYGANYDVHSVVDENHKDYDKSVVGVWQNAEVFDWRTERLFRYMQVASACVMSFAHGANDVANAMGPFAAVYNIWKTSSIPSKSNVPEWILVVGGVGIVCGLATFGYKIMRVLGTKAAKLTNARGFCVELSTAIVVMVASYTGLPVSTTQTVTGAIVAMGCFDGLRGVNWKVVVKMLSGWVLTLVVTAIFSAGTVSLALYAPSKPQSLDINYETQAFYNSTGSMIRELNASNLAAGANADPALTATLTGLAGTLRTLSNSTVPLPKLVVPLFQQTLGLYNLSSEVVAV